MINKNGKINLQSNNGSILNKILYYVIVIILIIVVIKVYGIYSTNNFNEFIRGEYRPGLSKFVRDKENKYADYPSYSIINTDYNDAMFYKTVSVKKNTPYKVTCMVKTKDVQSKENPTLGGAHLSIGTTTERSKGVGRNLRLDKSGI